jgi:hypothetical protein
LAESVNNSKSVCLKGTILIVIVLDGVGGAASKSKDINEAVVVLKGVGVGVAVGFDAGFRTIAHVAEKGVAVTGRGRKGG